MEEIDMQALIDFVPQYVHQEPKSDIEFDGSSISRSTSHKLYA